MAFVLQFGKYKGTMLATVFESDFKYVDWLHTVTDCDEVKQQIIDFVKLKKLAVIKEYAVCDGKVHIGTLQFKTKKDAKAMDVSTGLCHLFLSCFMRDYVLEVPTTPIDEGMARGAFETKPHKLCSC